MYFFHYIWCEISCGIKKITKLCLTGQNSMAPRFVAATIQHETLSQHVSDFEKQQKRPYPRVIETPFPWNADITVWSIISFVKFHLGWKYIFTFLLSSQNSLIGSLASFYTDYISSSTNARIYPYTKHVPLNEASKLLEMSHYIVQ